MFSFLDLVNNAQSPTKITTKPIPIKYELKDILVDSDEEKYECEICTLELFIGSEPKAFQCKEGHLACISCWERCLSTNKNCMTCKIPISAISQLSRNRYLEKEYSDRLVFCPNSNEDVFRLNMLGLPAINNVNNGDQTLRQDLCNHGAMKFSELENHYKTCESRILQCNLCLIKFCSKDSSKHQNECSKVFSKCEFCDSNILRSSLSDHHKIYCTKYLIECTHCKIMIERDTNTNHINDDCQDIMILCKEYLCGKRFTRSKMQIHSLEHSVTKLMNQNEIIKKENQSFLNQEKKMEEINQKLITLLIDNAKLKNEITVLKQNGFKEIEYSNKWVIPSYRTVSEIYTHKNCKESKNFRVGPHTFNIKIYPNGQAGKQGKFSVYLIRKSKPDTPLKYSFSFSLIPPDGSTATIVTSVARKDFEESKNLSWGFGVFTDSKIVLKDFLNERGELELSFSVTIQDEKIIPL
ncbi:hypothetical protein ACTFIZ_006869 [Dictyostelium cf. discoideum]